VRLFVAADVPEELRAAIESQIVEPLRDSLPGARFTRPEGRHLTLKFLGNVADERVDEIAGAVREATNGHGAFDASFAEVGGFPNLRRPRVLWIGIGEGADALARLAGSLDTALEALGFAPEDRPFRGHLTLARFKQPKAVDVVVPEVRLRGFPVDEIVLFRSHLHPKGARYEALEWFPLGG